MYFCVLHIFICMYIYLIYKKYILKTCTHIYIYVCKDMYTLYIPFIEIQNVHYHIKILFFF